MDSRRLSEEGVLRGWISERMTTSPRSPSARRTRARRRGGERGIGERATRVPGERRVYDSGRLKLTYVLLHEPTCFRGLALGLIGRHPVTLMQTLRPRPGESTAVRHGVRSRWPAMTRMPRPRRSHPRSRASPRRARAARLPPHPAVGGALDVARDRDPRARAPRPGRRPRRALVRAVPRDRAPPLAPCPPRPPAALGDPRLGSRSPPRAAPPRSRDEQVRRLGGDDRGPDPAGPDLRRLRVQVLARGGGFASSDRDRLRRPARDEALVGALRRRRRVRRRRAQIRRPREVRILRVRPGERRERAVRGGEHADGGPGPGDHPLAARGRRPRRARRRKRRHRARAQPHHRARGSVRGDMGRVGKRRRRRVVPELEPRGVRDADEREGRRGRRDGEDGGHAQARGRGRWRDGGRAGGPQRPDEVLHRVSKPEDDYLQYALFVAALWLVYEGLKATATLH